MLARVCVVYACSNWTVSWDNMLLVTDWKLNVLDEMFGRFTAMLVAMWSKTWSTLSRGFWLRISFWEHILFAGVNVVKIMKK